MIAAIVESNTIHKDFIADKVINMNPKVVGIYKLVMKAGSDNFKSSAIQGIMKRIKAKEIEVVIYKPELQNDEFYSRVVKGISEFKDASDVIVANRVTDDILDVRVRFILGICLVGIVNT